MGTMIVPTMKYHDAPQMIDWLDRAFGFRRHLVVPGDDGTVVHAQLVLGESMIMLGSAGDDEFDRLQSTPRKLGGTTQSAYVVVPDPDSIHVTAVAAGAEIVRGLRDEDYGGRGFSCRDPEGHLWNFGSYDPWAATA